MNTITIRTPTFRPRTSRISERSAGRRRLQCAHRQMSRIGDQKSVLCSSFAGAGGLKRCPCSLGENLHSQAAPLPLSWRVGCARASAREDKQALTLRAVPATILCRQRRYPVMKLDRDFVRHSLKCFVQNFRGLCKFGGIEAYAYSATIADQSLIGSQKSDRLLEVLSAFWALKSDHLRIDVWHRHLSSWILEVHPSAINPPRVQGFYAGQPAPRSRRAQPSAPHPRVAPYVRGAQYVPASSSPRILGKGGVWSRSTLGLQVGIRA
jgi:hypothetical protein